MRLPDKSTPEHCSRYQYCSANLCPLDADWRLRVVYSNEPVCYYLMEASKNGAEARFEMSGEGEMYARVAEVREDMKNTHSRVRCALERAKTTGSRMAKRRVAGATHE